MEEYKMTEKEFIEDLQMTEEFYNKGYFSTNTYYQIKSRIAEEYKNSLLEKKVKIELALIKDAKELLSNKEEKKMYKVRLSIDGIIKEITVNATDSIMAQNLVTNMYGSGKVQIIDIRRV